MTLQLLRAGIGRWRVLIGIMLIGAVVTTLAWGRKTTTSLVATVRSGTLTARLTTTGRLVPQQSVTYRSPLAGRESEITHLVAEGTRVNAGDLLARLDTTELQRELLQAQEEVRKSHVDLQVAEIDLREAEAVLKAVTDGEGALAIEESRSRLQLAQSKAERLREEYGQLKALLDKGFITRDELKKTAAELQQSEEEAILARRRAEIAVSQTHPRERQRAELQLAQKRSQLGNATVGLTAAQTRRQMLERQIEGCRIAARRSGLVIYEEFLSATPRRKVRVGDRVTGSQGLITIPEVDRMLVEASISEADVHRVHPGQASAVRVEAFPDLRLTGRVTRVGALARAAADTPFNDKRFDLIIELDSSTPHLRPEMTARAEIMGETRASVLLVPVNAVFERQGAFVVFVVRLSGTEVRPVTLGESDDAVVEVMSGVREGEQVALIAGSGLAADRVPPEAAPRPGAGLGGGLGAQPR